MELIVLEGYRRIEDSSIVSTVGRSAAVNTKIPRIQVALNDIKPLLRISALDSIRLILNRLVSVLEVLWT